MSTSRNLMRIAFLAALLLGVCWSLLAGSSARLTGRGCWSAGAATGSPERSAAAVRPETSAS